MEFARLVYSEVTYETMSLEIRTLTGGRQGVVTSENSETMGTYYPWVDVL